MSLRVQASQQSQRDFVANVSHDLKTPLTAIQGFAQAILDGTASAPADLQQAARIIHTESERMFRMVTDLLELARLDSGIAELTLVPLNLRPLLEQAVEHFSLQIERSRVNVVLNLPFLPNIMGDYDRLARLFANLLDNALKHTPSGESIHIQAHTNPDSIEVLFIDRGPGLPENARDRVFERFYQTDKSRSGALRGVGLGLSIAREIVLAHGGTIRAYNNAPAIPSHATRQSQEGIGESIGTATGATFVVKLPLMPPTQDPSSSNRG
jgi:signal transduction histidine kinase